MKSYEQKAWKFSKILFSQSASLIPLIFFIKNSTWYLPHFGTKYTILPFLVFKLEFFENCTKFFLNKKFKCPQHFPCNVLAGNSYYMSLTCVALPVVWKRYDHRDDTPCISKYRWRWPWIKIWSRPKLEWWGKMLSTKSSKTSWNVYILLQPLNLEKNLFMK